MKPLAIHFGTGALGRGLVIPFLYQSGYDVIAVDTDRALIEALKGQGGYDLLLSDTGEVRRIELSDVLHAGEASLQSRLATAAVITTSVRKENLHHIAKSLQGVPPTTVICCENIEESGHFFASQLVAAGIDPQGWWLPDCMVDRICSTDWPTSLVIEAESWGSICVQATPGATIPSQFEITENIQYRFQEKRILVNTYADGISFLGLAAGHQYLYESAADTHLNGQMADYMQLMKRYLQQECHLDKAYVDRMAEKHRTRLSNPAIKRHLNSVARNFLDKMAPAERFIYPLTVLQQQQVNIDAAIPFLNTLINSWAGTQADPDAARQQVLARINYPLIVSQLERAL